MLPWWQNFQLTTNRKRHLKSELVLLQTSSPLLTFIKFVKCWRNCLGLNPEGPYLKRKKRENLLTYSIRRKGAIRKFPDAAVQWRLRNVQKSVMHVQSCCFANLNLLLFSFSLPSPSSFLMLPSVVIQKFCFHGNVTSHFSSLFSNHRWSKRSVQGGSLRVLKILNNGDSFVLNIP